MRGDRWFPRVEQCFRIERTTTDLAGQPVRHEYAYGITSCLPEEAPPGDLLHFVQGHWGIENKVHWVRDVVFDVVPMVIGRGGVQAVYNLVPALLC
ncbi:MAG: hypothetical protein C7B46_20910 [Sulfobacillus benefaciens]|uniref:Transposase IS4-like domain-containing protein n=1 Tax=Sulfobacillus benefaciens TaxID=453960 RepID=A0A2T2WRA1_9FIRM|nr:MAG: hypothetical protein C7B46_20910 [Sulfobacillus benefaciens]